MEEGSGGCGGGAPPPSSTLLSGCGRQRFEVELRPGETTIVSWKKLVKDANKAASNNKAPPVPAPHVPPPVAANHALDSRNALPLGESAENEANDATHGSRFGAVIEKIERLYMGKNSSDEEDLNDVPDDDEYDTEDSFIDDTELDEYFQVDNLEIKHDGFFVNRGKLEHITVSENGPNSLPSQQLKKRRRKNSAKVDGGSDDGHVPNKHMKVNNKAAGTVVSPVDAKVTIPSMSKALPTVNYEDTKHHNPTIALGTVVKKSSDLKNIVDPSPTRISNCETTMMTKNIDKQNAGVLQPSDHGNILKDGSPSVFPLQRSNDRNSHARLKSQSGLSLNNSEESNQSLLMRERNVSCEQSEPKVTEIAQQPTKNPLMARKEGSCAKPRSIMLEKALRDLEKIVVESRPPNMEVPDADNSSQAVKRRMPPEIKHKLAKVARLAHAIHGKISKELLNRLMSIVGHLIQLRSLKRNLKNMVNMGLSAKEEKDARLQQLKKQIDEMVKIRAPMMKSKAMEQQAGVSNDFQETSTKEKQVLKRITMDDTLEDKICDLYDLFVEGLDEDAGPQVRKLYAELAQLWPQGFMDNHGIRRAICRSKDRRKTLHRHKDQEKSKRKNLVAPKTEAVYTDVGSVAQLQRVSDNHCSTAVVRSISNTLAAANAAAQAPNNMDKPKQEKLKGGCNHQRGVTSSGTLVKKAKKKPEAQSCEAQIQQERTISAQTVDKQKFSKQATKPTPPPTTTGAAPQPTVNSSGDMG